ncbi:MAG: hypothetical protein DRO36_04585 [Candidatus Hecatellales archaeon]|nr:MAG: hypothetical protein DRO36_04585 [Candidatus Hecatellales archaeon]
MENEDRNFYTFFLNQANNVMKANMDFMFKKCKDVLDSCIQLLSDFICIQKWTFPIESKKDEMLDRYLMYPMMMHVVYPNLQFVIIAVLLGAIPQAIYSLRTALEAIGIALYVDNKDEFKSLDLHQKLERKKIIDVRLAGVKESLIKIAQEITSKEQAEEWVNYILDVYSQLSAWIHPIARAHRTRQREREVFPAGLLRAIILTAGKYGVPPSYGLLIPMEYDEVDIEDLNYFKELVELTEISITLLVYIWSRDKDISDKIAIEKFLETLCNKTE